MQDKLKKTAPYILTALTIAVFSATLYVVEYFYGGLVYPNVMAANIEIGMEEITVAADEVEAVLDEYLAQPVVIVGNDEVYEFTSEQLGINYDREKIFASIPTFGNFLKIIQGKNVELKVEIDEEKLLATLELLASEIPAQNAYIKLDEESGEAIIIESQTGQSLDSETLLEELEEKFALLANNFITPPLIELQPSVEAEDLEPFIETAQAIFEQEVTIYGGDESWIFYPRDHSDWFSFEVKNTIDIPGFSGAFELAWGESWLEEDMIENEFRVVIDEEKLKPYLDELASSIEVAPQNVLIAIDEEGVVTFEGTGTNGENINRQVFSEMLSLALENKITEFDIPISVTKAGVDSPEELQELGVKELIATGYSSFWGSPYYRNLNIGVGLSKFNGVIVEPGETFSFLDTLGTVDYSTGYYQELVIKGNETIPEYGGGLCQVSSTMFRAILDGGLPIVTRTEHSYAVSYYAYPNGYGLDATIYQPWPDLQWTNDTGQHILIQAYSEGTEAYFKFYGTSDDRQVLMDGPYYSNYVGAPADVIEYTDELEPGETIKKDSAHTGFDVTWYRTIIFGDGTEATETILSHYQAWPAKYQVGAEEGAEITDDL